MKKMENYLYLVKIIAYFIIYSFFGWIMESALKTYVQKKFVNSGFLYGPYCPIYGFGAVFMYLFFQGLKNNIILLFIIAVFTMSLWEYIVGWLLEKIFHTKYWDYSNNKFNISGRVCLTNSICWGILGVIFIEALHPFIIEKIDLIQANILTFNVIMICIVMIIDTIVSIVKVTNITSKLEKLKEITETIKEKIEELDKKQVNKESIQAVIDELKYKQTTLRRKLIRQTNHLKKAFPTIKSDAIERLNEFLKEKKESVKKGKY
jgi:uncharacterized membrane protein